MTKRGMKRKMEKESRIFLLSSLSLSFCLTKRDYPLKGGKKRGRKEKKSAAKCSKM